MSKLIIYQVFTRLFGNANTTRKPHGTLKDNGCGKFADFTPKALKDIRTLGATHIWFTGIISHATRTAYKGKGLHANSPAVVKGEAGSPYAIRDYYDVCPDLATDIAHRKQEFAQLIERTHAAGLGAIIDFVPNHVSREYHSYCKPKQVRDLGEDDDNTVAYSPNNNFYYLPDQQLSGIFEGTDYTEFPARATGNDRFDAYPTANDWYETVKLNYGSRDTWEKMLQILLHWASTGIDGFRCDMAEMVPVEFWHYAIAEVKKQHPNILFIAEIYNPAVYRNYIEHGGFDYLYDKVGLYDTLRAVCSGTSPARSITQCWQSTDGLQPYLLNFLENHDEQRRRVGCRVGEHSFPSEERSSLQIPYSDTALVVSATINVSPFMLYFGQELGECGMDEEGFSGRDGRTTIFDYWSLDMFTRKPTPYEKAIRAYYKTLLNIARKEPAITKGAFYDLMHANPDSAVFNGNTIYAYLRQYRKHLLLIVCNFADIPTTTQLNIPAHAFEFLQIEAGEYRTTELLSKSPTQQILLSPHHPITLELPASNALIIRFELP